MNKKNVSDLHLFLLWVRHDPLEATLLGKSAGKLLHCAVLIHVQDNNPPPCLPHLGENSLVHRTCWSPKQPAAHTEKSYSLNDSSPQVSCYFRSLSWRNTRSRPRRWRPARPGPGVQGKDRPWPPPPPTSSSPRVTLGPWPAWSAGGQGLGGCWAHQWPTRSLK